MRLRRANGTNRGPQSGGSCAALTGGEGRGHAAQLPTHKISFIITMS